MDEEDQVWLNNKLKDGWVKTTFSHEGADKTIYTCADCYLDQFAGQMNWTKQCQSKNKECNWFREPKVVDTTYKQWIYFTISPSKKRNGSLNLDDMDDLQNWAKSWFGVWNYNEYFYVIEVGKSADDAHLHIHALVKGLKKKLKKNGHYVTLSKDWNACLRCKCNVVASYMEKQAKPWIDADILYQHINDKDLWILKYNYLDNDLKGTHRNFSTEGTHGVHSSN